MKRTAALACAAVLAACGDVGTAERLSSKETLDGIDVPTIGTVGDFPDPAHRHVVNVTADGRIVVEGKTCADFRSLVDELQRRGDLTPGAMIEGTKPALHLSDADMILRVDGELPWGTVSRLLNACIAARVLRVSVAVRHESDAVEGALGLSLIPDYPTGGIDGLRVLRTRVDVAAGNEVLSPAVFQLALTNTPPTAYEREFGRGAEIHIEPRTRARTAIALIDAALRAGCRELELGLIKASSASPDFQEEARGWQIGDSRSVLRINGAAIDAGGATASRPPTNRVHGTFATKVWVTHYEKR